MPDDQKKGDKIKDIKQAVCRSKSRKGQKKDPSKDLQKPCKKVIPENRPAVLLNGPNKDETGHTFLEFENHLKIADGEGNYNVYFPLNQNAIVAVLTFSHNTKDE